MHKVTYTSSRLCGGLVTRLTGRREYVHVGLTAAIPVADTCQSSHQTSSNSCLSYFMLVPNRLFGDSVTRLTGCREYFHVGLTAESDWHGWHEPKKSSWHVL